MQEVDAIEPEHEGVGQLDESLGDSLIKHLLLLRFWSFSRRSGYDSVTGPQDVKATWPHLDGFEDRMTEVAGPTCDTPGVV
jgi:hypothetical protein